MAEIQNDRDKLLQAASVRVVPVKIPIDGVDGLPGKLEEIDQNLSNLGTQINSVLSNTKDLVIYASATNFVGTGTTSPATIVLTAVRKNGLSGTISWTAVYGNASTAVDGDTCTVYGSTVTGFSVTLRARITVGAQNFDAYVTLSRLGTLAGQSAVNLTNQVTGQLSNSNISGLGALALLNVVNLNTQTSGTLNGATQVTNLGQLAYANAIAANQIGAGTLAAGVIYAGVINAAQVNAGSFTGKEFTGGTFTGGTFRTAASGARVVIWGSSDQTANTLEMYDAASRNVLRMSNGGDVLRVTNYNNLAAGIVVDARSGACLDLSAQAGVAVLISSNVQNHMILQPKSAFVSLPGQTGAVTMHSTHGLCIYDGTNWLKPAGGWVPV